MSTVDLILIFFRFFLYNYLFTLQRT